MKVSARYEGVRKGGFRGWLIDFVVLIVSFLGCEGALLSSSVGYPLPMAAAEPL